MTKILQAMYTNGNLILSEALDPDLEGKQVRLMIFSATEEPLAVVGQSDPTVHTEDTESRAAKLKAFLRWSRRYSAKFPGNNGDDSEALSE